VLYAVLFGVPDERAAEFERWYDEDHVPLLMEEERWRAVVRYRIVAGEPAHWTHLTLHYLAGAEALASPARERARSSPWRARLAAEPWFRGMYSVYQSLND
jgi:hypothetical protein